ncbi:ribosome maturation factor RimP [Hippea maritima]|uniref:Ribosome maturation factor RimP n=1 Tax=Hippea maritima (strain ATCC 700847 / DSM 10411 / MH2) TaxID=760142 RepID=F2LVA2_HIPMA|nr:ribosome maturation factor RimP [Hippea maritima]AEA33686.1 Ribosome maturation factor rimP [Hippea maritima DSM 10411]
MLSEELKEDIFVVVESLGYSVYDIELTQKKITIYIDKPGGVSIDDCELASRNISALLDVKDPFSGSYTLEVSSPGINRKLKTKEHFMAAIGKKCVVHTHFPVDNSKVFKGILTECNDNEIVIEGVRIEFDNIKKARIDEI